MSDDEFGPKALIVLGLFALIFLGTCTKLLAGKCDSSVPFPTCHDIGKPRR